MTKKVYIGIIIQWLFCFSIVVSGIPEKYSSSSVLSKGKWFKIAVTKDGIYRIDYNKLKQLGLENPSNPMIYGNNCGQLSYYNDGSGPDDLRELAIYTNKGADGIFNEGDYLLFYGQGTNRWIYDNSVGDFIFVRHNYSDTAFYFLTSGLQNGKRITNSIEPSGTPDFLSFVSDALFIHESETENIIHSGREWYQPVSYLKEIDINPGFKEIITSEKLFYEIRVLARASANTSFRIINNGEIISTIPVSGVDINSTTGTFARISQIDGEALPSSSSPLYKVSFSNGGEISAKGWIDYLKLHARKNNRFDGQVTFFTDSKSLGPGTVTEFTIKSTANAEPVIWDVTDPFTVKAIRNRGSSENISFRSLTDTLKTFVAFNYSSAIVPLIKKLAVSNQDLHSSPPADMIIVTHPEFLSHATQLVEIHRKNSGLASLVVTPEQIYNEFSGGIPDIAAIRNFLRMKFILQKGTSHPLRYLLLFGDGSFENKTPPPGNPNFIPTYQTKNSNIIISSFTSDDFYGLLEDGEGEESGTEDLGIGRITVSDTSEAAIAVSKIKMYLDPMSQGNWKNVVCLAADDEDGNTHMSDAEGLSDLLNKNAPWINIDKIYFDAYNQITTPAGQYYPDVTQAITDRINSGTLIFNFIGHGNENYLAHERVVTPEIIENWKNIKKLPLFITATCEFSRFDDIVTNSFTGEMTSKNSSGEKILLSEKGGAIALMSTTRLAYSAPNYELNRNIFSIAFNRDNNGNALRLGDIIKTAKNKSGSNTNKRNFVLLGDPAIRLSWPWHGNVVTDSINNARSNEFSDTLKALSMIKITGHIEDKNGTLLKAFNGTVVPVIYGRPAAIQTLANDGGRKMIFFNQNNILFSGRTTAINGFFRFTFVVPRDIDPSFGKGKISYYAYDQFSEMKGLTSDIIIGGFSSINGPDTTGPKISLFLNDTLFRNGGLSDPNPILLAYIEDNAGINTSGSATGHNILCWLDNDKENMIVLNNFYENDLGCYNKGKISYNFTGLSQGAHTLTLKVWDNFNNSNEKSITFFVGDEEKFTLRNLINYPNPFRTTTNISMQHNRPDEIFEINITIFNLTGGVERILKTSVAATGFQLAPVEWDGRKSGGEKAGSGVHPYRVTIRTKKGETATISGKMIIY